MKTSYLLPNYLKKIGWSLFVLGLLMGIMFLIFQEGINFLDINVFALHSDQFLGDIGIFTVLENNVLDELACIFLIIGALLIAFSKEKVEDEFIAKIRLESLVWATYFNYTILLLAIIFIYGMGFFWVMSFNIFTMLFFFIIRFIWMKNKSKKELAHEE
jgi:hypothetical protein